MTDGVQDFMGADLVYALSALSTLLACEVSLRRVSLLTLSERRCLSGPKRRRTRSFIKLLPDVMFKMRRRGDSLLAWSD